MEYPHLGVNCAVENCNELGKEHFHLLEAYHKRCKHILTHFIMKTFCLTPAHYAQTYSGKPRSLTISTRVEIRHHSFSCF
jgi:hypothetical protein